MPRRYQVRCLYACLFACVATADANAAEFSSRIKGVANWLNADAQDSVALFGIDPAYGVNVDARLTAQGYFGEKSAGPWSWEIAGEVTALQGDVIENSALFGGQSSGEAITVETDARRAVSLTTNLSTGSRHASSLRLDRAHLAWQREEWRVRIGRQALSLGSGLVFNPMDIFSPFAPTATDRDFKTGEDALVITRLGQSGSELEAIAVLRRALGDSKPHTNQGSFGLRYRATWQSLEYELLAARHFDANVAMLSLSGPLGGAVWRANWVGSEESGELTHSVVANIDYAFGFGDQAGYAFVEYYHNGYGNNRLAEDLTQIDTPTLTRLARGELFVVERNYLALGTSLGLSPLLTLSASALVNLQDRAPLIQSALSYTATNNITIEMGGIVPLGGQGDEFGGALLSGAGSVAPPVLTNTSQQLYVRAVWFF